MQISKPVTNRDVLLRLWQPILVLAIILPIVFIDLRISLWVLMLIATVFVSTYGFHLNMKPYDYLKGWRADLLSVAIGFVGALFVPAFTAGRIAWKAGHLYGLPLFATLLLGLALYGITVLGMWIWTYLPKNRHFQRVLTFVFKPIEDAIVILRPLINWQFAIAAIGGGYLLWAYSDHPFLQMLIAAAMIVISAWNLDALLAKIADWRSRGITFWWQSMMLDWAAAYTLGVIAYVLAALVLFIGWSYADAFGYALLLITMAVWPKLRLGNGRPNNHK